MARKNGDGEPTIVGVEGDGFCTVRVYLSDDTQGDLLACGTGSTVENGKWRDRVVRALEATIKQVAPDRKA